MAEIDFADGFDATEPVAWGLGPAQMGAAVAGPLLAYLVLSSPLPRLAVLPLAPLLAGAGLALALGRHEGRPLVSWLGAAARFWVRPRRGFLVLSGGPGDGGRVEEGGSARHEFHGDPPAPRDAQPPKAVAGVPGQVEPGRRVPLVLLPEPCGGHRPIREERRAPATAWGWGSGDFHVADSALLEVPDREDWWGPRLAPPAPVRTSRRVVFFSLSGGSGRTTLAVEVAGLLAGWRRAACGDGGRPLRVALLDLDPLNARAGIRLGVPLPVGWNLLDADPAGAVIERHRMVHASGADVFAGPPQPVAPGWEEQPDRPTRLGALMSRLEQRGYDVLVLDIPSGLGPVSRWALGAADDIFVVLTPTAGGVHDAYRSTAALRRLGARQRVHYVVNRSRGEDVMAEAMLDLGGTVTAEIPDDPALLRAETEHRLVGLNGSGATAVALRALAGALDPALAAPRRPGAVPRPRRRRWRRAG